MRIKDYRVLRHYSIPNHELQLFKEVDREERVEEVKWIEQVETGETEEYETGEFESVETGNMIEVETGEFDEDGNPVIELVPEIVQKPVIGERPIYEEVERTETVTTVLWYHYDMLTLPWREEFNGTYEENPNSENEGELIYVDYIEENFDILWEEAVNLNNARLEEQGVKEYLEFVKEEIEDTNKFDLSAYRRIVEESGDNIAEMDEYRYELINLQQELKQHLDKAKLGISTLSIKKSALQKPSWHIKY